MLRKHLRRKLRTFEENQISNIIQGTNDKRTLKFHQIYSAKNTRRDTHISRKSFFPNWKQQKPIILNQKPFKKQKIEETFFEIKFLMKVSGKLHNAENLEMSFMLVKRFVSSKN